MGVDRRARVGDAAGMRHGLLVGMFAVGIAGCGGEKTTSEGSSGGSGGMSETGGGATGSSTGATEPTGSAATDATSGGASGVPAKYSDGCAPDDGAAVDFSIGIAERACAADFGADAAMLRITLFQGATLPPGVYALDGGKGSVSYDNGMGVVGGSSGTLTIVEAVADGVVGSYDVTLSDTTQLSGEFLAIYCPQDVICG